MRGVPIAYCLAGGCQFDAATHLGVCVGHWQALPVELRNGWQRAWFDDGRAASWLAARAAALAYLEHAAA